MKVIIGYGNELRGEDGFGIEVIKKLRSYKHEDIKLITLFCLTPELILELLEADEILFIDACFDVENSYIFACSILKNGSNLSHHIEPHILMALLREVYQKEIDYSIYSMLTCNFEHIENTQRYHRCIDDLALYLRDLFH